MFDTLFQALFTHPPVVFQEGEFRFDVTSGSLLAGGLALAVVAAAIVTYRQVGAVAERGRPRDRVVLAALRVAALAIVVFCLFRPTLVVRAAVPQQNVLAVVLDDSSSMQIADWGEGQARAEFLRQQFGDSALMRSLSERFIVRLFRFSSTPGRASSPDDLRFTGSQTRLGAALDGVRDELAGLPVAGMVLVTDGADTGDESLDAALLGLAAAQVPVFTVGVGSERLARDIQIERISTPRTILKDGSLLVDVVVRHSGFGGARVTVDVEDEGRIVGSEPVTLPLDERPAMVRVRVRASDPGPRLFTFRVPPQTGEMVTQNNQRESLVNVRDVRERILYYEGEPRWEMGFLRRAVADDKNLELVALQRTADTRSMQLGGEEEELIAGFPRTREALFRYRGLVLGSVEAGAFTGDQLQMIADFVDRRGGGLLMIGGARSFGEGGYSGTPVAEVLPLAIDPGTRAADPTGEMDLRRLFLRPTRAGQAHAATQIAETEEASEARWRQLPQVSTYNAPLPAKAGATVLLEGDDDRGDRHAALATHQYGRGKAMAFTVHDTWQYQMHASISVEDQTHEHFWRQLLRGLVDGVPDTVEVRATSDRVEPGEPATIEATVVDNAFLPLNDAVVVGHVVRPAGGTMQVPMHWTGEREGVYRGTFVTSDRGDYEVTVDATRAGLPAGTGVTYVRAAPGEAEYIDPVLHAAPLRRIAEETGGRYYTADAVAGLTEDVRYSGRGVTTVEERELWHMPIVLLTLMGLVCAEWGYRRAVGLS